MLQLAAEGRLRLDDTLERYLPGVVPQGDKITIRQLLNHRSGLANVTDYERWLERASRSPSTRPIDVLRFAASQPLTFEPGSRWRYSNTNYIALGLVIEQSTGTRTGRSSSSGSSSRSDSRARSCRSHGCYRISTTRERIPPFRGRRAPSSRTRGTSPASSPLSLRSDRLEESLAEMKQTVVVDPGATGDGLGIFSTELPCGRFWGHDGGILDYRTIVKASEDGDRIAVISGHRGHPAGPRPDETALLCPSDATTSRYRFGAPGSLARMARFGVGSGSLAFARLHGKPRKKLV